MRFKENKGITLIILIVTIIVLLIISGITISAITGGEGTMNKANQAKNETEIQAEMEELQKIINQSAAKGIRHGNYSGSADAQTIREALKKNNLIQENPDEVIIDGKSVWVVTGNKTGSTYTITYNGEVSLIETINDVKTTGNAITALSTTDNTIVQDDLGNNIVIPSGFGIASDSGTKVEDGIVIEDATSENTSGSQFVWVPVGKNIKVSEKVSSRKADGTIEIKLGRYSNFNSEPVQDASNGYVKTTTSNGIKDGNYYYYEFAKKQLTDVGDSESVEIYGSETENTKALNIKEFVASALKNNGYYIARFEAGVIGTENIDSNINSTYTINNTTFIKNTPANNTITIKKGMAVWNYINQPNAATVCQNMYGNNSNYIGFKSDLINSYAWDTTLTFIKQCGDTNGALICGKAKNEQIGKTGENVLEVSNNADKQCNIYDLNGNDREWSTESFATTPNSCTYRGGYYNGIQSAIFRTYYSITYADKHITFRPILYIL